MQQLRTIVEAERYLDRFYANARAKYTLDNMRVLMKHLDNPQDKFRTIHIAGTSGKTSTAYYVSALLTAGGAKTGLTVSPHVDSLTERVQINGKPLSEDEFCVALTEYLGLIESAAVKPSWFEVVVSFAYWYFAKEKVDYAVVEVGLGGLLDGTNVITRPDKVCVITDIGLDHTNVLGHHLSDIAAQKIGIVQPGNLVLTHKQPPEVMEVFERWCRKQKADLQIKGFDKKVNDLPAYQARNWQLAYAVYQALEKRDGLSHLSNEILSETRAITIPGRMDIQKRDSKTIIMDGAHNAQKMSAFLDSFRKLYPDDKPAMLIALKEGKEYEKIIPLLSGVANNIIVTTFQLSQDTPLHSMDPKILADAFKASGQECQIIPDPQQAYKTLLASPEPVLVVTGSFYLLSQIRNNKPV